MLYLGYLFLLALLDFLVTGKLTPRLDAFINFGFAKGTIGFLASYWAIRKLYSAIRID